jgi:hypothetical protein
MEPRIETKPKTKHRFESISRVFLESILSPPFFVSHEAEFCNSNCRAHPRTQLRVLLLRALNSLYSLESAIRPCLLFQGSRPCLFYDVSTSRFREAGLRIPFDRLRAAVSPIDTP